MVEISEYEIDKWDDVSLVMAVKIIGWTMADLYLYLISILQYGIDLEIYWKTKT